MSTSTPADQAPKLPGPGDCWDIADFLRLSPESQKWIVHGFLRPGSQVLLAGPPKSGKSLLASEIALALAKPFSPRPIDSLPGPHAIEGWEDRYLFGVMNEKAGPDDYPGLKVYPKNRASGEGWKVLFLSLEMGVMEIADRLPKQLKGFKLPHEKLTTPEVPADLAKVSIKHIFGLMENGELLKDLKVITIEERGHQMPTKIALGSHFTKLQDLVQKEQPDVVIFDTLIQLHDGDENNNVLMKSVMRAVRGISTIRAKKETETGKPQEPDRPLAHIVVHHTRKESAQYRAPLSPEIMRGAGSIHGTADLVMLTRAESSRKPTILETLISSRSSSIPDFKLVRDDATLTHKMKPKDVVKEETLEELKLRITQTAILQILQSGQKLTHSSIQNVIGEISKNEAQTTGSKNKITCGPKPLAGRINTLIESGLLGASEKVSESGSNLEDLKFWKT